MSLESFKFNQGSIKKSETKDSESVEKQEPAPQELEAPEVSKPADAVLIEEQKKEIEPRSDALEEKRLNYLWAEKNLQNIQKETGAEKVLKEKHRHFPSFIKVRTGAYIRIGDSNVLDKAKTGEITEEIKNVQKRQFMFISELRKHGLDEKTASALYEKELRKTEYDAERAARGKEFFEELKIEGKNDAQARAKMFQEIFLNEEEKIQTIKLSALQEKEKNIAKKMWDWWVKQGTITRLGISTAIMTGLVVSAPFIIPKATAIGAIGALLYAGRRFGFGLASTTTASYGGKGIDKIWDRFSKHERIEKEKNRLNNALKSDLSLGNIRKIDQAMQDLAEAEARAQKVKNLVKGGAMLAAGAGAVFALSSLLTGCASAPLKPKVGEPPQPSFIGKKFSLRNLFGLKKQAVLKIPSPEQISAAKIITESSEPIKPHIPDMSHSVKIPAPENIKINQETPPPFVPKIDTSLPRPSVLEPEIERGDFLYKPEPPVLSQKDLSAETLYKEPEVADLKPPSAISESPAEKLGKSQTAEPLAKPKILESKAEQPAPSAVDAWKDIKAFYETGAVKFNSEHWERYFEPKMFGNTKSHFEAFAKAIQNDGSDEYLKATVQKIYPALSPDVMPQAVSDYKETIKNYRDLIQATGLEKIDANSQKFIIELLEKAQETAREIIKKQLANK